MRTTSPCLHEVRMPRTPSGRGTLALCFHKAISSVPCWGGMGGAASLSSPPQVPILAPECEYGAGEEGGGGGGTVPSPGLTPAGRRLAGSEPGSSPGPGSPPPAPRAPPDPGGRAGAAAANERARRLREPGRLCPPGIGHAVGSGGRGLGGPRAWLGQACCWVTGRRVSPGNGGGYRSLAGREGGGARAQAGPADPSNSARPPPRQGAVTFTRAGRSDPADTGAPAQPPPGSRPASGPGRPAALRGPRRPPPHRGKPGLRACSEKLSPSQLPLPC